jgi:nitrogen fixation/metabolism regulation signal transduction histidine kinase
VALRVAALCASLALLIWMASHTAWYVSIAIVTAVVAAEGFMLMHFATRSGREVARFLDAVAFDDPSIGFSALREDAAFGELGAAMARVLDQMRRGRAEREEQSQYLQALVAHIPVALVMVDEAGGVQLLNMAARRLFERACTQVSQFAGYGESFGTGMEHLPPGESTMIRMERAMGSLQLKAAATDMALGGKRRRLISLQNIESELTAQELAAWQTVIRVMAHEVMNSLTPVSSLAATAQELVGNALKNLVPEDPNHATLSDACEALEAMTRRSEGLLHFVQNHRRLTKRMVTQVEIAPVRRVFARLQRLLATEMAAREIELVAIVVPETLEVAADVELLDQALINLMRNAIEALREGAGGRITLSATGDTEGHVVIAVADNGPGIALDQRDKVFVPFFTTKRQGSGVGLTLVRQIATVHGATVAISDTAGGGATVSLRF